MFHDSTSFTSQLGVHTPRHVVSVTFRHYNSFTTCVHAQSFYEVLTILVYIVTMSTIATRSVVHVCIWGRTNSGFGPTVQERVRLDDPRASMPPHAGGDGRSHHMARASIATGTTATPRGAACGVWLYDAIAHVICVWMFAVASVCLCVCARVCVCV